MEDNTEEISVLKLKELEIGSPIPTIKLEDEHLPLSMNPFFTKNNKETTSHTTKTLLFGKSRTCKCSNNNKTIEKSGLQPIRSTIFKSKKKQEQNNIIKEPLLKNIGICVHQCLLSSKQNNSNGDKEDDLELSDELEAHLSLNNDSSTTTCQFTHKGNNLWDFRSIAEQCSKISASSTSPISSGTNDKTPTDFSNQCFKHFRSKQFGRIQQSEASSSNNNESTVTNNSHGGGSSCSQQARIQHTSGCDVTINEIASYFELLYIPKKMSSMAESMYI